MIEKDYIDLYSATELGKLEGKTRQTITTNKRYIKVRIENTSTRAKYKQGVTKKPYGFKYIKWDDVKEIAEKQFGKKITFL